MEDKNSYVLLASVEYGQKVRKILEERKIFDKSRRLKKVCNGRIAIPVDRYGGNVDTDSVIDDLHTAGILVEIGQEKLPSSKTVIAQTPYSYMVVAVKEFMGKHDILFTEEFELDIPTHWERHGDLLLFPGAYFTLKVWRDLGEEFWLTVAKSLNCSRLAQKGTITSNGFRTPQVVLLLGSEGWVHHKDNGIRYTYDLTKCMFSAGNITEKLRIANFNCTGETVVDLYAGIGYFTLPYLVHANALHVHACEWNPDAVEALSRNLVLNRVSDRCTIHHGDNRETCPKSIADRVNLGLIPSSEDGWPMACAALKSTGGFLHIHSNVTSKHSRESDYSTDLKHQSDTDISNSTKCSKCGNTARTKKKDQVHIGDVNVVENETSNNFSRDKCIVLEEQISENTEIKAQACSDNDFGGKYELGSYANIGPSENIAGNCTECSGASSELANNDGWLSSESECRCKDTSTGNVTGAKRKGWDMWAQDVSSIISQVCTRVQAGHCQWTARIVHIEHVKSYAPHIDHVVLDLECRPSLDKK